jgi:hypothetical protein
VLKKNSCNTFILIDRSPLKPLDEEGNLYYAEQRRMREKMKDELLEQIKEKELANQVDKLRKKEADRELTARLRRQQQEYEADLLDRKRNELREKQLEMEKLRELKELQKVIL